jgi:nucleoside phosphorylase
MKLAIFAAFPQELKHLRKNFEPIEESGKSPFPLFVAKRHGWEIIAVQTGMSLLNIDAAFRYVLEMHRPDAVLSVGFCGALYSKAQVGDLIWASHYLHLSEGETKLPHGNAVMTAFPPDASRNNILEKLRDKIRIQEGSFVTLSSWMPKSRLMGFIPQDIPFPVCDRETFYIAKWSYQSRLPFFAVRSVTDRADEDIPRELFQVTGKTGHYSFSRALGILIAKPSLIFDSVKLGRNAARASRSLCHAVNALLEILSAPETRSRQHP